MMQRRIQHSLPLRFDVEQAAARLQKLETEELEQWADSCKEQIERWGLGREGVGRFH